MENASDALKMAFAILVFIIALSIVFSQMSKIKETADVVLEHTGRRDYFSKEGDLTSNRQRSRS